MDSKLKLIASVLLFIMFSSSTTGTHANAINPLDHGDGGGMYDCQKYNYKSMKVDFTEAYYADLDGDGQEDDIRLEFNLLLYGFGELELENGVSLYLTILVITPAYNRYRHEVNFETNDAEMLFVLDLIDHAFDNGWYFAMVRVYNMDDRKTVPTRDYIVFDPPGGLGGGDPRLMGFVVVKSGTKSL